ncbi:MAG: GNAT family N-acetyltransferase [Chitinophagaceae bacterium]
MNGGDFQFDYNNDYCLEDDCVLLRPLLPEDCGNLLHFALEEPEIWQFALTPVTNEQTLKSYLYEAALARKNGVAYAWIVWDKITQKYAGSTRFYDINEKFQSLLLGYTWYGKKFQGTGINIHCKYLLLSFAFEKMQMERVEFRADANNSRSIAAMKKIGCKVEGVLRSHMPTLQTKRRDSIVLSILKREWFNEVKPLFEQKLLVEKK